jgi:hypothetical protein
MKFSIDIDYVSHAFARSKGLEHPTFELEGYVLLQKSFDKGGQFV